jgi:hypothetical protein
MAALFLTTPASIFIKILLSSWTPVPDTAGNIQTESLSSAGKYIGILERLLVFTFIMVNHWEGVGLWWLQNLFSDSATCTGKTEKTDRICINRYIAELWNGCFNRNFN